MGGRTARIAGASFRKRDRTDRSERTMYPSLTRVPGDLFSEFETLQRQVEQLFGARSWPSSIRAAGRGAFPALNMGVTTDAVEIYAFAPGLDPAKIEVRSEERRV